MDVTRRDFLTLIAVAGGVGALTPRALAQQLEPERLLDFQDLGNVTLLHMTDAHAGVDRGRGLSRSLGNFRPIIHRA